MAEVTLSRLSAEGESMWAQVVLIRDLTKREFDKIGPATQKFAEGGDRLPREAIDRLRQEVQAGLKKLRGDRDRTLSIEALLGFERDNAESTRVGVPAVDARVDDLWRSWLVGASDTGTPNDWDVVLGNMEDAARALELRREVSDRVAFTAIVLSLLVLALTTYWIFREGSPPAYASAWTSAIAAAFMTNYRLRSRISVDRLWLATLAPPFILAVVLVILMFRTAIRPTAEVAVAASVVLLLVLLMVSVATLDRRAQTRPAPLRMPVDIPDDIESHEYAKRLGDYLEELRVDVLDESLSRLNSAREWRRWFMILGASAALLSAGAGVTGLSGELAQVAAIAALIGAGLTATLTLLNPAGQAQQAAAIGASCGSLAEEIYVLIRLDLPNEVARVERLAHIREQVETISTRFDELREVPQRPRLWEARHPTNSSIAGTPDR